MKHFYLFLVSFIFGLSTGHTADVDMGEAVKVCPEPLSITLYMKNLEQDLPSAPFFLPPSAFYLRSRALKRVRITKE